MRIERTLRNVEIVHVSYNNFRFRVPQARI